MIRPLVLASLLLAACATTPAPTTAPADPNLLVSAERPSLTLRIDPAFVALPPLAFPIENLTDAERRIYVDAAPDRTVRRMVVVQFEKVQTGSDFRFVYPSTPPRRFGAETYRHGAFAFDEARAAAEAPLREPGRTRDFLAGRDYRLPHIWKAARLARVTDADGLSEVIIFYLEAADAAFPQDVPADGVDLPAEEAARLFDELERAVQVVSG